MGPKDSRASKGSIAIEAVKARAVDTECCALVIGLARKSLPKGSAVELDKAMGGALSRIVSGVDAGPELGKTHMIFTKHYPIKPERIILVGIGGEEKVPALEKVRLGFAAAAKLCEQAGLKKVAGLLPPEASSDVAQAMVEGFVLGAYHWDRFKAKKRKGAESFTVLAENAMDLRPAAKGIDAARVICDTVWFVRDLSNMPGNEMHPKDLAAAAMALAKATDIKARILGPKEIAEKGMNGILTVSKGSAEEPRFIELEYNGARSKNARPIVLVGKAITFDSGGISLKPVDKMDEMKFDMSGGAVVMGVVAAAKRFGLPLNLVGLIPCSENMPGGRAYRPGDVITYKNGKTVEVISTDAEGRLILADALLRAAELVPRCVVDIATLTMGIKVVLAGMAAGVWGNDDGLVSNLVRAGEATNERLWRFPLWPVFDELIEGDTADIKNSGGRDGGSITASRFLSNFISYPWAHIDIAGTAWVDKDHGYLTKGGTAFGVRLFIQWLRGLKA
jgi:leucyl aminopeptidase